MSVARNLWRVADAPHIVPADSVERQTAERLINACPAGLFSLTPEGNLRIDYRSCLECGTCRTGVNIRNAPPGKSSQILPLNSNAAPSLFSR